MTDWRRHQLVWLDDAGWRALLTPGDAEPPWDEAALGCLRHWAAHDLPLVVTRQPARPAAGRLTFGLPAPARWGRQRLFLHADAAAVSRRGEFPPAAEVEALLPPAQRPAWRRLCAALDAAQAPARCYGSCGWQVLTGLEYLHARSDVDLLVACSDAAAADAAAARLHDADFEHPRLDGELAFDDGAAVAWREWSAWRAGRTPQILVKRLHGAALAREFGAAVPA